MTSAGSFPQISWIENSSRLIVCGWETQLWDLADARILWEHAGSNSAMAVSPDEARVAIGMRDRTVKVCSTATGETLQTITGFTREPCELAWSPKGTLLAAATFGDTQLIDMESYKFISKPIRSIRWYTDTFIAWASEDRLLVGDGAKGARVWNTSTQDMEHEVAGNGINASASSFALSADGSTIAFPAPGIVKLSRIADGQHLRTIVLLTEEMNMVVSPDGHYAGPPGCEEHFVYVALSTEGQSLYTPSEFAEKFGWKNDPNRAVSASR
jgi:WD40 repeat protein